MVFVTVQLRIARKALSAHQEYCREFQCPDWST
jgi:hypothetical protein